MTGYKIFNDPLYGFIAVPRGILLQLIDHPYVQRLHRIRQLGLTYLVYPGALHTRFHHALGSLHLVQQAVETLRSKGIVITDEESLGVQVATLLHDIGHGPFSHSLENILIRDKNHEDMTRLFMYELNAAFNGQLQTAIDIFENRHPKKFLHNLVSGQLDMDRLDYLNRDSFYTGVSEGVVSSDRIIKMLNVHDGNLVVEQKGIYSIEKFLIARRLMYWQVYLHKTVLSAERMLVNIMNTVRNLTAAGRPVFIPITLQPFFDPQFKWTDAELVYRFSLIDDADILFGIKHWMLAGEGTLKNLCERLLNRRLYKIRLSNEPFEDTVISEAEEQSRKATGCTDQELSLFCAHDTVTNSAYNRNEKILILFKDGTVKDIAEASDLTNISVMSTVVKKYFLYRTV